MVVPLASPPSCGEMRRNFSKRTPGIQPCRDLYTSPNARFSLPAIPSVPKCSRRRSGFYCKPLGFEDVARLKVVWNLLIPSGGLDGRTVKAKTASPQFTATKALALGKRPDRRSLFSRRKIIAISGGNNSKSMSGVDDAAVRDLCLFFNEATATEKVHQL